MTGNYSLSIDIGERLRLRKKDHVKNLVNLSNSYFLAGFEQRSLKILDEALDFDVQNKKALELKAAIESIR